MSDSFETYASVPDLSGEGAVSLFLEVFVNGKSTGLVAEFSADLMGGNMTTARSELEELGIRPPSMLARQVALSDISGLTYKYDATAQAVHITLPSTELLPEVISASYAPAFEEADSGSGAVLNYSLVAEKGFGEAYEGSSGALSASLDGWIFTPFARLGSTALYARPLVGDGPDSFTRLDSSLDIDMPRKAAVLTLGDFTTRGPSWTRPVRLGGVQLRRDFSLRSDLVTDQRLSYSGAAAVPSSVDVFIENNRVFSTTVDNGPFRLEDVPITGGGDAQIVVQGADGTVQRETVSFFSASNLLKKGTLDFSLGLGRAREAYGLESDRYGDTEVLNAGLRYGLTRQVTLEAYYASAGDLQMAGVGLVAVPMSLGELSLATATSDFNGQQGGFWQAGVSTSVGGIGFDMTSSRTDPGYADLAYVTGLDYLGTQQIVTSGSLLEVPLAQDVLSLSVPTGKDGRRLGVSLVRSERESSQDRLASVSWGTSIAGGRGSLSVNGSYNFDTSASAVSLGLSLKLGKRSYAQAAVYTDLSGQTTQDLTLSRAMGDGPGAWGYQAQIARRDEGTPVRLKGDYRARYAGMSTEIQQDSSGTYLRGQIEGAVAMAGGAIAFGQRIDDSFAVVDVGLSDVPVYLDNRPVAQSNGRGRALITDLNAWRGNRISVDVTELPSDASLGVSAMDVVPARGAGKHLNLGGSDAGGARVVLRDASGAVLPAGSVVTVKGQRDEAYVGYDGETWIEGASGPLTLNVALVGGTCTAQITTAGGLAVTEAVCR